MPTWFERNYAFLDPTNPADGALDQDGDGLTNLEEYQFNTLPDDPDTDDDTLSDAAEVRRLDNGTPAPTNPRRADTDQDGLSDAVETDTGAFTNASDTGSDPLQSDSDGDGFADGQEVAHNVVNYDGADPNNNLVRPDFDFTDPLAIINLDATELSPGPLPVWTNSGALSGDFKSDTQVPTVTTVAGVRGVAFDGLNDFYTGPIAPVYMTRTNSRTIDAWIYNPAVAQEETIFAWSRRGGVPDGSNMSFNHGTDPVFGAAGHWGAGPDVGWNGNISTGRWTYVAYTYDHPSRTVRVFRDGQQANTEVVTNIMTHSVDTVLSNGLPFRVASQSEANGTPTPGLRGSMTIARIRVYDEALTPQDIANRYNSELPFFIPRLSIAYDAGSGTATITWLAVTGRSYTVESSNDLATWNERLNGVTTGSFVDNQAGSIRFYRIRLE